MTIEYILLLSLFVFIVMGTFMKAPKESFLNSGPRLGARVEKQLSTGDGFNYGPKGKLQWEDGQ